jgi:hypothetical protein
LGKLHDKELALAVMALYQLWLARNETRDGTPITDPLDVARRTIFLVEEWAGLKPIQVPKLAQPNAIWQAPAEGWHKVNADGAFSSESGNGGCGVVLRNHHGQFVAGASHFLTSVADPEGAEVEACRKALVLARNMGVASVLGDRLTECGIKASEQGVGSVSVWSGSGRNKGSADGL